MAQDRMAGPITLTLASTAAALTVLSANALLVDGIARGSWDYRRAVVISLPYALIWGFVGGGLAFILCRRVRARSTVSLMFLAGAAGVALALICLAALDTPSGGGLPEFGGALAAGWLWGAVVGWLGWRVTAPATDNVAKLR